MCPRVSASIDCSTSSSPAVSVCYHTPALTLDTDSVSLWEERDMPVKFASCLPSISAERIHAVPCMYHGTMRAKSRA